MSTSRFRVVHALPSAIRLNGGGSRGANATNATAIDAIHAEIINARVHDSSVTAHGRAWSVAS